MAALEPVIDHAFNYRERFDGAGLPLTPRLKLAVLTCMDSRIDVFDILGLQVGDAHVIRNAGGAATDDAIRSLAISQRVIGTEEILVMHHSDCGMLKLKMEDFVSELESETGYRPSWLDEGFSDLGADVARSVAVLRRSPFLRPGTPIRGVFYDVATGRVTEPRS